MSRAMKAAARSQIVALLDRHRLEPNEVVALTTDLLSSYGQKAGWDRCRLHEALDEGIAGCVAKGRAP